MGGPDESATRAAKAPVPEFLELAASLEVSAARRGATWDSVVGETRRLRASVRR
jgi:hypothetical protein